MKSKGIVYLVGAGPGDLGLLTLRGAELIGRADVVVYDALVNKDLLRLAPKTAEIIYGGKRSKDHAIPQDELNALLIAKARKAKLSCGSKAAILIFLVAAAKKPRNWPMLKFPSKWCPEFPQRWPRQITPAFPLPIAIIAPVIRSLPATKIRPRTKRH